MQVGSIPTRQHIRYLIFPYTLCLLQGLSLRLSRRHSSLLAGTKRVPLQVCIAVRKFFPGEINGAIESNIYLYHSLASLSVPSSHRYHPSHSSIRIEIIDSLVLLSPWENEHQQKYEFFQFFLSLTRRRALSVSSCFQPLFFFSSFSFFLCSSFHLLLRRNLFQSTPLATAAGDGGSLWVRLTLFQRKSHLMRISASGFLAISSILSTTYTTLIRWHVFTQPPSPYRQAVAKKEKGKAIIIINSTATVVVVIMSLFLTLSDDDDDGGAEKGNSETPPKDTTNLTCTTPIIDTPNQTRNRETSLYISSSSSSPVAM